MVDGCMPPWRRRGPPCILVILAAVLAGGRAGAVEGPLAEQIKAMRQIVSMRAEMTLLRTAQAGGALHVSLTTRNFHHLYWEGAERVVAPDPERHEAAIRSDGLLVNFTRKGSARLDIVKGLMFIKRSIAGVKMPPGAARIGWGEATPPLVLHPFLFLGNEGRNDSSCRFDWADLWDDERLAAQQRALIKSQRDDGAGGVWMVVPLSDLAAGPDGTGLVLKDLGRSCEVHVARSPDVPGLRVITELRYLRSGQPAPMATITYRYRMVTGEGIPAPGVPLVASCQGIDAAGKVFESGELLSVSVGQAIKDADLEIDPALARNLFDADSGLHIETE
jgi:hypothetical protein